MTRELQEALAPLEVAPKSPPMLSIRRLPNWTCLACGQIMENNPTMRCRMKLVLKRRHQRPILKQAPNPFLYLLR